jgi:hypothetical protein
MSSMLSLKSLFVAVSVFVALSCQAAEDEASLKFDMRANVSAAWKSQDMREIERLSQDFRTTRALAPSGAWKLSVLHNVLHAHIKQVVADGEDWDALLNKAARWTRQSPSATVAHLFYAAALEERGWSIRGVGFAVTVSPENMAAFGEQVRRARDYLQSVKAAVAADPGWYESMLRYSAYESLPAAQVNAVLAEAVAREPDYLPSYYVVAGRFGTRWGGSPQELEDFVRRSVASFEGKRRDEVYARLYSVVILRRYMDNFARSNADCERVIRGMKIFINDFPDPVNINLAARVAGVCGDGDFARALIPRIGANPMQEVWGTPPSAGFDGLKRWAGK